MAMKRRNNSKIHEINKKTILASAGDVPFIHRLEEQIDETIKKGEIANDINARQLRDFFCMQVHGIRCEYLQQFNKLGNLDNAPFAVFILCSHDGTHQAYLITADGIYERIDGYEAIGSSKSYAEVILMNQYDPNITVEDGKQLAYWAIRQCCELDPFVGLPIKIMTLQNNTCEMVPENETKAMESSYSMRKMLFKELNKSGEDVLKILDAIKDSKSDGE